MKAPIEITNAKIFSFGKSEAKTAEVTIKRYKIFQDRLDKKLLI